MIFRKLSQKAKKSGEGMKNMTGPVYLISGKFLHARLAGFSRKYSRKKYLSGEGNEHSLKRREMLTFRAKVSKF